MTKFEQVTAGNPFKVEPTTNGSTHIAGVNGVVSVQPNEELVIVDISGKVIRGKFSFVEEHYLVLDGSSYISYTNAVFVGKPE